MEKNLIIVLKIIKQECQLIYNHLLKKSNIEGLTKRPKGETKVIVRFDIDVNGILNVKAEEESTKNGQKLELTIKNDEISLSSKEIEDLKKK